MKIGVAGVQLFGQPAISRASQLSAAPVVLPGGGCLKAHEQRKGVPGLPITERHCLRLAGRESSLEYGWRL
jgi:hypothetical protein